MSAIEKDSPPAPSMLNRGMTRREALSRMALLVGGTIVGAEFFLHGTRLEGKQTEPSFSTADLALMDEIGETIIPTTNSPGAKAAGIGAFMAMMVKDGYDDTNQAVFKSGLGQVEEASKKQYGKSFLAISPAERTALLGAQDADQKAYQVGKPAGAPPHYFQLMKQMVLLGYFTSEIGCTQALRYVEVPGSFNGNVPYKKGDRAWFIPTRAAF